MTGVDWFYIALLSWFGQTALKLRPNLEERIGTVGATVFFYCILKFSTLRLFPETIDHFTAGVIAVVLVGALYYWLKTGTLEKERQQQEANREYQRRYNQQSAFLGLVYDEEKEYENDGIKGTDLAHGIEDHGRRAAYRRGKHAREHDTERDGLP